MSGHSEPLRLCAVSFKPCWRDASGRWMSSGGFPLQMTAVGSLFEEMDLLIVESPPLAGGLPLPAHARVVPLRAPRGADGRRKLSVAAHLPGYVRVMAAHIGRADAVHVPLPGDLPLIAFAVALAMRKRLVARYGGSWLDNAQTTRVGRITKGWMRRAAGGRNVMMATGDGSEPPAPGMEWIFSTALAAAELDTLRADLDRPPGVPPRLVYVGRLSPEKGVATLLRALAQIVSRSGDVAPSLTLAGEGSEREALVTLARTLGLNGRVRFTGQLDRAALSTELARADLCVQPSLTEGFSKAWLDAMAHGLPVVASEVGAARAVIGGAGARGWLVPPGDPAALADTLLRVLAAPVDWAALRRRCRTYVEGRTLEAWAGRIGEICASQWGWSLSEGRLHR